MASRTPTVEEGSPCRFSASLFSAVSEWILIFLIFLNGLFSYMTMKFARYCKLQTPCLFCTRFDHVLDRESQGFYDNLICTPHKLEISSMVYCHIHWKLADVRETCENCLLSFSTEKRSNSETYRSLVGKLGINHSKDDVTPKAHEIAESDRSRCKFQTEDTTQLRTPLFQSSKVASFKLKHDDVFGLLAKRLCSCCTKPFRMRSHAERLLQAKSVGVDVAEPDASSLGLTPRDHSKSQEIYNKLNELNATPRAISYGSGASDKLVHIGYKELKINSDSESEVLISDDDDDGNAPSSSHTKEENVSCHSHRMQVDLPITTGTLSKISLDDTAPKQMIEVDPSIPDVLLSVPEKHDVHTNDLSDSSFCKSNISKLHGLEELSWDKIDEGYCAAISDTSSNPVATNVSNKKDAINISEATCSTSPEVVVSKAFGSRETVLKPSQDCSEAILPIPNVFDLNDTYKLVIVSKASEQSPKYSSQVPEDLKLLLTQISRSFESPWNDMIQSPKIHGLISQDSKISEGSGTSGQPNLTKRLSLERNEYGFEGAMDGSIFGEIDGECSIDKVKRYEEFYRKSSYILYKELEEERSASAIAANQAMAMITRLQEEKATMQMEALQYQRMMEEQVEYDLEALQQQHDLLAEREKEIQELEAELGSYRRQFGNDYGVVKEQILIVEEKGISKVCTPRTKEFIAGSKTPKSDSFLLDLNVNKSTILRNSMLYFEEEKLYISEYLKELEKKIYLFPKVGPPDCETKHGKLHEKNTYLHEENNQIASNTLTFQDDSNLFRENSHSKAHIMRDNHENGSSSTFDQQNKRSSTFITDVDRSNIKNQISDLKNRLESFEADRYFLEHMINSLHNGKEGLLFVQQIAQHLQELRKITINRIEKLG